MFSNGWNSLTAFVLGVLRLKKHKETEARRMLLRNSSTGKINIVCVSIVIQAPSWLISSIRILIFIPASSPLRLKKRSRLLAMMMEFHRLIACDYKAKNRSQN